MYWKIENMDVNHSFNNPTFYNSISGSHNMPSTHEMQVDITMRVRDVESIGSIEDFEKALIESALEFDGEKFTREEIYEALQEMFPERFI